MEPGEPLGIGGRAVLIVRIKEPKHRHYGRLGTTTEAIYVPGDWPEPRYRITLTCGTVTSATEDEIEPTNPELTD